MKKLIWAALILINSTAWAQVGSETDIWDWVAPQPYHESVVQLSIYDSVTKIDRLQGTGVLFFIEKEKEVSGGYYGYVLTAYHVADEMNKAGSRIIYRNNAKSQNPLFVGGDREADIAIFKAWVPKDAQATSISRRLPKFRETLDFAGLGGYSPLNKLRTFMGRLDLSQGDKFMYSANSYPIPGDSGGPAFLDGKVAGIISGGMIWMTSVVVYDGKGGKVHPTYPGRISSTKSIQDLVKRTVPAAFK